MVGRRRTLHYTREMPSPNRQPEDIGADTSMPDPPSNWPPPTTRSSSPPEENQPLSNGSQQEQEQVGGKITGFPNDFSNSQMTMKLLFWLTCPL